MIRFFPPKDLAKAGRVSRAYAFQEIALVRLDVRRKQAMGDVGGDSIDMRHTDSARGTLSDDGERIVLSLRFDLVMTVKVKETDESVFALRSDYELVYRKIGDADVTQADVGTFAKINAIYSAWPFIRELVSSCLNRSGYPGFLLGPLVIAPEAPKSAK